VLGEGQIQAGAAIAVVSWDPNAVSVADVIRLFTGDSHDRALLDRAMKASTLPRGWRSALQDRLDGRSARD